MLTLNSMAEGSAVCSQVYLLYCVYGIYLAFLHLPYPFQEGEREIRVLLHILGATVR